MDREIRKERREGNPAAASGLTPASRLILLSQQLSTLAIQVKETAELLREEEIHERQRDAEADS